jgi:hypothetical protein
MIDIMILASHKTLEAQIALIPEKQMESNTADLGITSGRLCFLHHD